MFKIVIAGLVAAAGLVSALDVPEIKRLVPLIARQTITNSSIPATCQSGCTQAVQIYNACLNDQTTTCLEICQQSNFNSFTSCFQCLINNTPGLTTADVMQVETGIQQLQQSCMQVGTTVTGGSVTGGSATSGSVSGAASGIVSNSLSFTSASGGVTISGLSTSGGAATTSGGGGLTPAAGSTASATATTGLTSGASAAAATTSKSSAAGLVVGGRGVLVGLVGTLVAVGAGAAMVL